MRAFVQSCCCSVRRAARALDAVASAVACAMAGLVLASVCASAPGPTFCLASVCVPLFVVFALPLALSLALALPLSLSVCACVCARLCCCVRARGGANFGCTGGLARLRISPKQFWMHPGATSDAPRPNFRCARRQLRIPKSKRAQPSTQIKRANRYSGCT